MIELALLAAISALAFASASVDSLVVLTPLMGRAAGEPRRVAIGYLFGVGTILSISWAVAWFGESIPASGVHWLGGVPIALGVIGLARLARGEDAAVKVPRLGRGPGAVAVLTLSLSSDNFGVLIPLFAESPRHLDPAIVIGCALTAGGCLGLATFLARVPSVGRSIEHWGARGVPFILIAIGLYILLDTPTDRL